MSKRDGRRLTLRSGQDSLILSASSGLDSLHEELFHKARRAVRRNPDDVRPGVQMTVFGCFWLEGLVNLALQELISLEVKSHRLAGVLWRSIRRVSIHQKLEVIAGMAKPELEARYSRFSSDIRRIYDLRNRLAHYRYEEEDLDEQTWEEMKSDPEGTLSPRSVITKFQKYAETGDFPDTQFRSSFKGEKARQNANALAEAVRWVIKVRNDVAREHDRPAGRPVPHGSFPR